ncbi:MAG: YezD family protein [Verrucomicrobiaceae bacterium]
MPKIDINEDEPWLEVVRQKAAAIRFGSVQITVHYGRVTQVESLEKTRFTPGKSKLSSDSDTGSQDSSD